MEVAASPSGSAFGKLNEKIGQQHLRGLLWHGEIFERLVQHPALIEIAEAMLGDDMVLGAYTARILYPGAIEMGVHIDYPYWAMRGPFTLRPPLMLQVIWMLQEFTEKNGATLVAPRSQLRCARPNREEFAREAIKITGAAGDAIISHGLLWHDTSQNHTEQPRVALSDQLWTQGDSPARLRRSRKFRPRCWNARRRNSASCSDSNSLIHSPAI